MDLTGVAPALGLDAARAADPSRYAIAGRAPRIAVRPASADELAEAVRAAASERLAIVPWGGGAGLAHDEAPERYDAALDLTALDRLIEYEPEDLTLTAECGITLAALRSALAARGQELPIEGAFPERATLGGALAANASGARRLRFGAPRDRVLGASFVLGDGTRARTGGKVVKNVAGYGIHRLLCGSRGGLATLLTASLKLLPAPAARVALTYTVSPEELADASRWADLPRLEPAAFTVLGPQVALARGPRSNGPFIAVVALEDDVSWVTEQERRILARLGDPVERLEGNAAAALVQRLTDLEDTFTDLEDTPPRRLSFATSWNSPAALGVLKGEGQGEGPGALLRTAVFHVLAGRLHVFPETGAVGGATLALERSGFTPIEIQGVPRVEPAIPKLAAIHDLRGRIREALDPGHAWGYGDRWQRG